MAASVNNGFCGNYPKIGIHPANVIQSNVNQHSPDICRCTHLLVTGSRKAVTGCVLSGSAENDFIHLTGSQFGALDSQGGGFSRIIPNELDHYDLESGGAGERIERTAGGLNYMY